MINVLFILLGVLIVNIFTEFECQSSYISSYMSRSESIDRLKLTAQITESQKPIKNPY